MQIVHPILQYLLLNPDKVPLQWTGWVSLAKEMDWSPEQKNERLRGKSLSNKWHKFKGSERGLELKEVNFGKDGSVLSHRVGRAAEPKEMPSNEGLELEWMTTSNNGGGWVHYTKSKTSNRQRGNGYGLTLEQSSEVGERLTSVKFSPSKVEGNSGVGVVDFSDLHTGAVLKYTVETVKTLPFDIEILTRYIDEAVDVVNGYGFTELHVFLPGDLVESFTAFNHRDSWKNVQFFQGGVTIVAYQILKRLFENLNNVASIQIIEGNHDRMTADKEGNSRKGLAEVLAFFISENSGLNVNYHPWLITKEIDGVFHLCTHGDHKPFQKNDFWFRYGKQGIYNVLRTGHFHGFNVLRQTQDNLHYQCPSIFTGNFFSESIGFDVVPGITIVTQTQGIPKIDYRPLISAMRPKKDDEKDPFLFV